MADAVGTPDPEAVPDPDAMIGSLAQIVPPESSDDLVDSVILALNRRAVAADKARNPSQPIPEEPGLDSRVEIRLNSWKEYTDTLTGESLRKEEVESAMKEELSFMRSLPVWERIATPSPGDKPVPCKWVFKAGAGGSGPRARLVACEVKHFAPDASEYAATPPIEAFRAMVSLAASHEKFRLDFLDVRKAHLNAASRRRVVVRLPKEAGGGFGLL